MPTATTPQWARTLGTLFIGIFLGALIAGVVVVTQVSSDMHAKCLVAARDAAAISLLVQLRGYPLTVADLSTLTYLHESSAGGLSPTVDPVWAEAYHILCDDQPES